MPDYRPRSPRRSSRVHGSSSYYTSHDTYTEQSRHHTGGRRHRVYRESHHDSHSHDVRYAPHKSSCCSPDNLHRLGEVPKFGNHYVELPPSEAAACCSRDHPHKYRDSVQGDPARHYFEKAPPRREADYDKYQAYHGFGDYSHGARGARSTRDRKSSHHSSPSPRRSSHAESDYSTDEDSDSSSYPRSHGSKHDPRRPSGTRKPSYTTPRSARTKAYESRRDGPSDSRPPPSSHRREESSRHSPRPDSKYKSSRSHHHDRDEYESKGRSSHYHHASDDRRDDRHSRDKYRDDRHYTSSAPPPPPPPATILPDYYKILGISSGASADEIKKAARTMRVTSHPDKLRKQGMSERELQKIDERAALVGQAADVLQDGDQKVVYDLKRARCTAY